MSTGERTTLPWHRPEALKLWIAARPAGRCRCWKHPADSTLRGWCAPWHIEANPWRLRIGLHSQAISGLIHWGLINRFGCESRARLIVSNHFAYGSETAGELPAQLGELG